jgi:hypothetical protein
MAVSDIPEFLKAQPGDLVRAADWNTVQHLIRASLRSHEHTRPGGTPPVDSATTDVAQQIDTDEIADGAVTAAKLASGAVSSGSLPDGGVTTPKLADGAVTGVKIANSSVNGAKLSFQNVGFGSLTLAPGASTEQQVQLGLANSKTAIYFPTVSIAGSTGSGNSGILAQIVYRQTVGKTTIDLFIHLSNNGTASADIVWAVLTFSS